VTFPSKIATLQNQTARLINEKTALQNKIATFPSKIATLQNQTATPVKSKIVV
jgi:hypothetical protein